MTTALANASEAKIFELIAEAAGTDRLAIFPETRLDSLSIDSLEFMELVLEVEKAFKVKIGDEAIQHLNTANDFVLCVNHLLSPKH